jgi:hypothetical protein
MVTHDASLQQSYAEDIKSQAQHVFSLPPDLTLMTLRYSNFQQAFIAILFWFRG